jgi:glyoxylase-like metal-dependent hydrolase (beta-lactamase superfamily II)
MEILTVTDSTYGENSYLLVDEGGVFIIDPGFNGHEIKELISGIKKPVREIFLTHGHYDHIHSLSQFPGITVRAHIDEKRLLEDPEQNLSAFTENNISVKNVSFYQGDANSIDGLEIFHTPGHTQGSVVLVSGKNIFSGDTLFEDSVGRTDLPSGDSAKLKQSLEIFRKFDIDSIVYPGHGKPFLLKDGFMNNFFLKRLK